MTGSFRNSLLIGLALVWALSPGMFAQKITVDSADPSSTVQGTTNLNVTIKGRGFDSGSVAEFLVTGTANPGGVIVRNTTFVDSRTLVANLDVDDAAVISNYDIAVYSNGRTGKGIEKFAVQSKPQPDKTAPDAVSNLQVDSFNHFSADISWTASGDDGMIGTATSYQIRYLQNATWLDESNWATAKPAVPYSEPIPVPAPAGTTQTFLFAILEPDTDYAFGIRVLDEAGNISPIAFTSVRTAVVPPTAWTLETVDSGGDQFAFYLSMALDSNGLPGIAYFTPGSSEVSFARWNGSSWELEVVDATNGVSWIDFEFGPADEPAISYDAGYRTLMLARKDGAYWKKESLDRFRGGVGSTTALAFDDAGYPMIAYTKGGNDLVLARSNGSSWLFDTVESAVSARYIDLALDPYGSPAVAYSDKLSGDGTLDTLKIAESDSTGWNVEIVPSGVPLDVAGVFAGIEYNPVTGTVALVDKVDEAGVDFGGVRYLQRDGLGWIEELVGHEQNGYVVPRNPSLAFDSAGIPHVSFSDAFGLYFASRTGDADTPWVVEIVQTGMDVGFKATLNVGQTSAGEVAYIAFSTGSELKLAGKILSPAP